MGKNRIVYLSSSALAIISNILLVFVFNYNIVKVEGNSLLLGKISSIIFGITLLVNIPAGVVLDKLNKKKILMGINFFSFLVCFIGLVLIEKDNRNYLYAILILLRILYAFFALSDKAVIPQAFFKENIKQINGEQTFIKKIIEISIPIFTSVFPLLFEMSVSLLVCSIFYFISSVLLFMLKEINVDGQINEKEKFLSVFKEMYKDKKLRAILLISMVSNFFLLGVEICLPNILVNFLDGNAYSIVNFFQVVGSLSAPIFFKYKKTKNLFKSLIAYTMLLPLILLMAIPNLFVLSIIMFSFSFCLVLYNIQLYTYIQMETNLFNIGKTLSILFVVSNILNPISSLVFGYLSIYWKGYALVVIGAIYSLSVLVLFVGNKKLRKDM
ncbi:hypothetical protein IGL98_003351 [Enterococcus sp. DIV0840]|uniref:MFS transporter n=1 Tax=Enterococcus TaxID=1350 RepID=UPI001A8EF15E|nr:MULTISPECIES: MFS transporter [Enterococcus]MBO0433098.1 MFS transporter [Enterococcus sp. DIV0849a]MBO0473935.1 MFS transporter [Enterococcus ureasiticus]